MDGTEDGIEMTLGDNGVSCKLSKRLPDYVKTNVSDFVDEVLVTANCRIRRFSFSRILAWMMRNLDCPLVVDSPSLVDIFVV